MTARSVRRFALPVCLVVSALLLVGVWRWWDWSRSIDLRLSTDFPYSYCVDTVSGEILDVSPEGDLRLRVDPRDGTAWIDIVGPAGLYRAKIHTYSG